MKPFPESGKPGRATARALLGPVQATQRKMTVSNDVSVQGTTAADKARKQAWTELQLLLARTKLEGAIEFEQMAWEVNAKKQTDASLRTAAFAQLNRQRAEAEVELCALQVAAISPNEEATP